MTTEAPKLIHQNLVRHFLPKRNDYSHKGSFGSALILAGSQSYTGAALLSGKACLRSGVGLVEMAVPKSLHAVLAGHLPEAIWSVLPEDEGGLCPESLAQIDKELSHKTGLLIGPGIGLTEASRAFGEQLILDILPKHAKLPTVIDADMLTILSGIENWRQYLPQNTVLTPHPGEMARLTGLSREEIQANRLEIAHTFAIENRVILVLKGADTLVSSPNGTTHLLPFANAVLAHAGSGDVLAGMLTGLIAQGTHPFYAACLAVWLHAKSGLLALEKRKHAASVLPSDLIDHIGMAMAELEKA
jgi:NAD(P)H-hydrate epimerase